jgi:hypothetical protein
LLDGADGVLRSAAEGELWLSTIRRGRLDPPLGREAESPAL